MAFLPCLYTCHLFFPSYVQSCVTTNQASSPRFVNCNIATKSPQGLSSCNNFTSDLCMDMSQSLRYVRWSLQKAITGLRPTKRLYSSPGIKDNSKNDMIHTYLFGVLPGCGPWRIIRCQRLPISVHLVCSQICKARLWNYQKPLYFQWGNCSSERIAFIWRYF